jgi:hypothetical protein
LAFGRTATGRYAIVGGSNVGISPENGHETGAGGWELLGFVVLSGCWDFWGFCYEFVKIFLSFLGLYGWWLRLLLEGTFTYDLYIGCCEVYHLGFFDGANIFVCGYFCPGLAADLLETYIIR